MIREDNGIEVRGLVKQFNKGPRAVDGIDLDVAPGEIYGFLGPNGAGKSTTVNMLVTLLPLTEGRATVAGWDVATQGGDVRKAIGAALQAVALDRFLTGREHLKLIASLQGITGQRAEARAATLLERVGLEDAADRKVGGYSGGMQRRLDLALALVHEPRVLFLDEPTTGLDPQSRTALWEEVRRLAREDGVTVFLTTQYLEEADVLADRVGIINAGRIVAEGTPAELKAEIGAPTVEIVPVEDEQRLALEQVLLQFGEVAAPLTPGAAAVRLTGGADKASLVTIVRAVDDAGLQVAEVRQHEPTLDDVFLTKTGLTLEGAEKSQADARAPEPVA
jgi:ABC-2 type transport system ATP-binding protein